MKRSEFRKFCTEKNLVFETANTAWHNGALYERYLGAIINCAEDFEKVKYLIDSEQAFLSLAQRLGGQRWFKYKASENVYARELKLIQRIIADEFAGFLADEPNVIYYRSEDIERREKWLADNPRLDSEDTVTHFCRVVELVENNDNEYGWIPGIYVTEPGYWHCFDENLIFSEKDWGNGIWHFKYDNWECGLILILDENDQIESVL